MNYLALRNEVIGTRFDSSQDANVKNWMTTAYGKVWNAAPWGFKDATAASLTVVAGNDSPTMPSDFGDLGDGKDLLFDQYGYPLKHLPADRFEVLYRADKIAGRTGSPEAFKCVNDQIVLGPTPASSTTFTLDYRRRMCSYLSDGTTKQVGMMSADTDLPFWRADHHMTLVYATLEIGGGMESDLSGVFWSSLYNDALSAMIADLCPSRDGHKQWGRWSWP